MYIFCKIIHIFKTFEEFYIKFKENMIDIFLRIYEHIYVHIKLKVPPIFV